MTRSVPSTAALLVLLSAPAGARAQDVETCPDSARDCQSDVVAVQASGCDGLIGFELDSGWLPSGNPIQVRFVARLGGLLDEAGHAADVEEVGELASYWPEDVQTVLVEREEGGRVRVGYGLEVTAQIRYDLEYAGVSISGTVDIPVPFVSDALRGFEVRGEQSFPSFAGDDVTAEGNSDRRTLFDYDVLGPYFDLPFGLDVHGGFRLDARGFARARYEPGELRILEAESPTVQANRPVRVPAPDETGYGPEQTLTVEADGKLSCEVGITFLPTLYISIASAEATVDFPVDLTIDGDSTDVSLTGDPTRAGLPDISLDREVLDLGEVRSGTEAEEALFVENEGDRPLDVRVDTLSGGIATSPASFTVPAGSREVVTVTADLSGLSAERAGIVLVTNDPDRPSVGVGLLGEPIEPEADPGSTDPGGAGPSPTGDPGAEAARGSAQPGMQGLKGGCSAARGAPAPAWPLALLGVVVAGRLRRRR